MSPLPPDYLERVYAGVLGKLIGVYLGRPFENWTHQRIISELGHVRGYVHEKVGVPLLVTDDDISGTFAFVRALEEHGSNPDLPPEAIGKTWLNNVINRRTVFWWGGRGVSTEHTAYLNLRQGIPAPLSGAIETNGKTVAEQIGAQIFIDAWAMVAPGQPALAAKLAEAAGSVSHDGESVLAAKLWAAMEAEAFVSKDVEHLLDTGLQFIPRNSQIARLISDIRAWVKEDGDWLKTRQRIEDVYGYDKFYGQCHVIPNHGLMVMALLYGGNNFHEAMHIVNTSGWDTDCNSGNLGCLVALMHGLPGFEGGPDWRGPLADRALISSADGGYSVNNAARIALDLANQGFRLAGESPPPPPKSGAQFHFTFPGSVQGFQASYARPHAISLHQGVDEANRTGLRIHLSGLAHEGGPAEVFTETFRGKEEMNPDGTYPFMVSPLVYPGQKVTAVVHASQDLSAAVNCHLMLRVYSGEDDLVSVPGPGTVLSLGASRTLEWTIPDDMDSQPIQQLGIIFTPTKETVSGTVWLDRFGWSGSPHVVLRKPLASGRVSRMWCQAWVDGVDKFQHWMDLAFTISTDSGEGIIITGTRDWVDYHVNIPRFRINFGHGGLAARVQGLNRYYALMFVQRGKEKMLALVKAFDGERIELASVAFDWELDTVNRVGLEVKGSEIRGYVGTTSLEAIDGQRPLQNGGVGLVAVDGSVAADSFEIVPNRSD